jgi:hypothetical protein
MRNLTMGAMRNLTFFAPSRDDLVLLLPRVSERAKAFAYYYGLDDLLSRMRGSGGFIAEPTFSQALNTTTNATKSFVQSATPSPAQVADAIGYTNMFTIKHLSAIAGIFTYLSSRWAIVTLVIVNIDTNLCSTITDLFENRPSFLIEHSSMLPRGFR